MGDSYLSLLLAVDDSDPGRRRTGGGSNWNRRLERSGLESIGISGLEYWKQQGIVSSRLSNRKQAFVSETSVGRSFRNRKKEALEQGIGK